MTPALRAASSLPSILAAAPRTLLESAAFSFLGEMIPAAALGLSTSTARGEHKDFES